MYGLAVLDAKGRSGRGSARQRKAVLASIGAVGFVAVSWGMAV